jgi:DNA-binding transcriptional ArsR family regulator
MLNRLVKSDVLDRTFAALSDPTRRDILARLARGPTSITELARPYGISLPGVLKHVRVLEAANLVRTEKKGRMRECRLGPGDLGDVTRWIQHYRRQWEGRLNRLEAIVERRKGATSWCTS